MKPKEKEFCELFCQTANPREAAFRAGYKLFPDKKALALLESEEIQSRIRQIREKRFSEKDDFKAGLRRIAFGSIADAVKLMLADSITDREIEGLDLFGISEIKRQKGGGMEIKFFDRLKALEKLSQLEQSSESAVLPPFYEALKKGAEALKEGERDEL